MVALREGTILVGDGRRVGFAEYGVRGGLPVLHFHGMPGGRFYDLDPKALGRHGTWMFTLERPGIGLSDPKPGRTLLDWAADVETVADALGFEHFGVLGTSAGAPYALACAYAIPDRCRAVALVCPLLPDVTDAALDHHLGPFAEDARAAREDADAHRASLETELAPHNEVWAADPDGFWEFWVAQWPETDRPRFEAERARWDRILAATYGGPPAVDEWVVLMTPWGFRPEQVSVRVGAWQGDQDHVASLELTKRAVDRMPDAQLTVCSGEGHYLGVKWHDEYLEWLVG